MATEAPVKPGTEQPPGEIVKPKGDGFLMKIMIVGILLLVVMAGEFAIVIYFFGNSGKDTVQPDPTTKIADTPNGDNKDAGTTTASNLTEVEIERFNCANGIASQGFTIHVTFRLVATVSTDVQQKFYDAVNKEHKFRVQQAVDKVIRSSTQDELKDANLDRIKRRIREDINKVLGNSYIQDVIVTEFRMMEQ